MPFVTTKRGYESIKCAIKREKGANYGKTD